MIGLLLAGLWLGWAAATAQAYKPLLDPFLRLVPAVSGADMDAVSGALLAPLLQPRVSGSAGHAAAQAHLAEYFRTALPEWKMQWQNSSGSGSGSTSHLIFRREPPWTRPGQANLLTLAAHYDMATVSGGVGAADGTVSGGVGAADAAVSCALLLHVARSIEGYAAQMYREMAELGEGGTVPMDMGVQVVFLDAGPTPGADAAAALAAAWEHHTNPALAASLYGYPNELNQISLLLLLDLLGPAAPSVPSRFPTTHWAYRALATVEQRMRQLQLLQTPAAAAPFFPDVQVPVHQTGLGGVSGGAAATDARPGARDYVPFMRRGVSVLPVVPATLPDGFGTAAAPDDAAHLDTATVHDWSRILTGFVLEWLDMMEVMPGSGGGSEEEGRRRRRRRG